MGSGASITYAHGEITYQDQDGERIDLDPAEKGTAWWAWAAWMRPDGAIDANAAASMCASNTGPSNCGEAAAFSVITALGMTTSNSIGGNAVAVNSRYRGDDLAQYLAARSVAGCTANDVVNGVQVLSNGR